MKLTKCKGKGCKKKNTCYRHTASSVVNQEYLSPIPVEDDGFCEFYWEVVEKKFNKN